MSIAVDGTLNPFHEYLIPLSSNNEGVLHALLGLTACHMRCSGIGDGQHLLALALQHRAAALQSLSSLLLKESHAGLTRDEEEFVLAMVLLLVLHDVRRTYIHISLVLESPAHTELDLRIRNIQPWRSLNRGVVPMW